MNSSRVRWGRCVAIALTLLAISGFLPTAAWAAEERPEVGFDHARLSVEIRETVRRY